MVGTGRCGACPAEGVAAYVGGAFSLRFIRAARVYLAMLDTTRHHGAARIDA